MRRFQYILTFMIAAFVLVVGESYAQTIPDPLWPSTTVTNRSVKQYTVTGDQSFASTPSRFVWHVSGGTLYANASATVLAGDGTTVTIDGEAGNISKLWVKWDKIYSASGSGYVYAYEISADGCEQLNSRPSKYVGMNLTINAPPKASFVTDSIISCSYDDSINVIVRIVGMPPFDLVYKVNGVQSSRNIQETDLSDLDLDGNVDNISIKIDGFKGTTSEQEFDLELVSVESEGIPGTIETFAKNNVTVHVQPTAPSILEDNMEVTVGIDKYYLLFVDPGVVYNQVVWRCYDESGYMMFDKTSAETSANIRFTNPGVHTLIGEYFDKWGCLSYADTLLINVYEEPSIAFADSLGDITGACSQVTLIPNEKFDFLVEFHGAMPYEYTYYLLDYNGNKVIDDTTIPNLNTRFVRLSIDNTLVNSELPEQDRTWTLVIKSAKNAENINVTVLDSDIPGGRDERRIVIHPKPVVHGDIEFNN